MATVEESMALAMEQMESEENLGGENAGQEASATPAATPPAGRARGEGGKFAKGDNKVPENQEPLKEEPTEELKPAPAAKEGAAPAQQPAQTAHKAPVSWRPELRGKFGSLPPEIQEEVVRRERDIETGMRESSQARRFAGEFSQVIQPYAAMIQSENATPLQAVQALMNSAYQLRTAAPQQKAQMVAQLINQYGVDIEILDNVLAAAVSGRGNAGAAPNDASLRFLEQKLAPVQQFMERFSRMEQNAQSGVATRVQNEIQAFATDPANEYYADVREDIADILEMAARRGQTMTLQDAYKRATMAHPTISKLIADKTLASTAQQRSSAAQRSRVASASLPSGGAPGQGSGGAAKPKDLYSAVEAAWDQHAEQSKD